MQKVLIINHKIKNCGVYQLGKRVFDLASKSQNVQYVYKEIETYDEYQSALIEFNPEYIIYNYHSYTMPWLTPNILKTIKTIKHLILYHEKRNSIIENYDKYIFLGIKGDSHPIIREDKSVLLPRPLLEYSGEYKQNIDFTIGSFGFGFWDKGFHTLTKLINDEYPGAIINYHLPYSYYGDRSDKVTKQVIAKCQEYATNITLNVTREFLEEPAVLNFLAANDINVFNYDNQETDGISSVIDYALSVDRPIAITNSNMFRHIKTDAITLNNNSIADIYDNDTIPLESLYDAWAPANFIHKIDKIFLEDL